MTKGVLLLNVGTKCMIRSLVCVHSLRKVYKGQITLICAGEQEPWYTDLMVSMGVNIQMEPKLNCRCLVYKAKLWKVAPYELNVFIDADFVVLKPIDEYFEHIKKHDFCTGEFAGWKTSGGKIKKRIMAWKKVFPELMDGAVKFGKAVNTGMFGFQKGKSEPFLKEWEHVTETGQDTGCSRIPDELGCQLLCHKHDVWIAPVTWGMSVKHGEKLDEPHCIHYHGKKSALDFPTCTAWKTNYWELYHKTPKYQKQLLNGRESRTNRYLKGVTQRDITIVTAVDKKYLPKLKKNYSLWMKTEGLMEYPMICYYNGIELEELDFLGDHVRCINWNMSDALSQRENMLTAFVLGTANEIKTKYWLKIDADTTPIQKKDNPFGFKLEYKDEWFDGKTMLVGQRCGYTKSKAGTEDKHFLNILDEWWERKTGEKPIFPADIPWKKNYRHSRIASFICLHKSKFVQYCAKMCDNGRLPIPSHDSFLSFIAIRMKKNMVRVNFKKDFKP